MFPLQTTLPGVRVFVLGSQRVTEASLISLIITPHPRHTHVLCLPVYSVFTCVYSGIFPQTPEQQRECCIPISQMMRQLREVKRLA